MALELNYGPAIVAYIQHARILFPGNLPAQANWVRQQVNELRDANHVPVVRTNNRLDFEHVTDPPAAERAAAGDLTQPPRRPR